MHLIDHLPLVLELLLASCLFCIALYLTLASKRFWQWIDPGLLEEIQPLGRVWVVPEIDPISRDWVVVERFVDVDEEDGEIGRQREMAERKEGKRVRWGVAMIREIRN